MLPRFLRRRPTADPATTKKEDSAGSLARFILIVAVLAWTFRSLVGAPFNIPSGSMLPTLYIGDYLAVAKWPYGYSRYSFPFGFPSFEGRIFAGLPTRGDVVVFRHPNDGNDLIKRVIGLPGDAVELRGGRLILNGRPVTQRQLPAQKILVSDNSPCRTVPPSAPSIITTGDRAYCVYRAALETLPGGPSYTVLNQNDDGPADDYGPTTVPAGHVFLMGDNRDDSLDSRFDTFQGGIGMVPVSNIIGRAAVTFWSTDGSASYLKPWTWFTALRGSRLGNGYQGPAE